MTDVDSYKGKKKHGLFHKIKELKHKHEEPKMEISGPTDFKHESHIGWDEKNGFEIKNIPPEWRQLFQQAGITKKELKNPDTVQFIYSVIGENINNQKMGMGSTSTAASSGTNIAGSAGGVLPPSQRARAPPPPPPGAAKVQARGPPPKPGAEIRQLPQKHAQTSKPLPPQPGQNKQMAQQQPPGQYQRRPSNPQMQQPQQQPATNIRGNLPTTIGGKPIPVTMIRPGGDAFVTSPTSRQAPQQQPPQQQQQQFNSNEPLIQQEVKTQYVLDEPLQPTLKRMPQSTQSQNQQYQQQPINNQQNITTTTNADGSQTFTYKPQSDAGQQYTYQTSSQQQGYNNFYSVQSPQQPIQQSKPQQMSPQEPQQPPIPTRKLPTPGQQRKGVQQQTPPPIPTSKRPAVQPPIIQNKNITSPQTRIQPPIIQRTQPPVQTPAVIVSDKNNESISEDNMPPPPPPMPESIAHIVPEQIDPKSPLPPPPRNAGIDSIPPVSLNPSPTPNSIPSAPPPPPPSTTLKPKTPIASPPTSAPTSNIPPQTDARSNLMDSIRNFGGSNHLKKVDPSEPLPDLKDLQLGDEGNRSLVETLAAAMAQRRGNLGEEEDDDDEDSDWDC